MDDRKPGVAIIGTGALGSMLARRLHTSGYRVEAVFSRSPDRAEALAGAVEAAVASDALGDLPEAVSLVFCCVPDDAIGPAARALRRVRTDWTGTTVAHTSGARTAAALYGLDEQGATLLSFHPLQTFTRASTPEAFEGIYVGLEGDAAAVALGARVAEDLGARPVRLSAEAKARYHLAASMASNFLVTLMAIVGEVLGSVGISRQQGAAMMRPLVEETWRSLERHLPEDALTGPIVRGDQATVALHTDALATHLSQLMPLYAALSAETVRVAVRSGRLDPEAARHILDHLSDALESYNDASF